MESSFYHFFQRRVGFVTKTCFCQVLAPVREKVADGDNLDVWVVLKAECGAKAAVAVSNNPDADFAIGDRFPDFFRYRAWSLVGAGVLASVSESGCEAEGSSAGSETFEKLTAGGRVRHGVDCVFERVDSVLGGRLVQVLWALAGSTY